MKQAVLLAVFIGIILVACSNGVSTAVEQAANIDATVVAATAATRTASDVQEKVAATVSSPIYKNHWDQGYSYLKNGHYQLAINEFDKAIQIGGDDDAGAYNSRGYS